MPSNAQKTLTDAGYIVVGLGVMGFQQAQIRARAAGARVSDAGSCVAGHARGVQNKLGTHAETARTHAQTARTQAEAQVRNTAERAGAVRDDLGKRVEPVVGQVQAKLSDLPERVVQAMEPVAARVRGAAGNAA